MYDSFAGKLVAVKEWKSFPSEFSHEIEKSTAREIRILNMLNHVNVIQLLEIIREYDNLE